MTEVANAQKSRARQGRRAQPRTGGSEGGHGVIEVVCTLPKLGRRARPRTGRKPADMTEVANAQKSRARLGRRAQPRTGGSTGGHGVSEVACTGGDQRRARHIRAVKGAKPRPA